MIYEVFQGVPIYECDPDKNKDCEKTFCVFNIDAKGRECIRNGGMEDEGYSGRMMPRYSGNHGDMNYAGNMNFDGTYSGRRSPSTGRYMSRGYSGHSIHDRMIAALEGLHDDPAFAGKPYENEEINRWIDRLRTNN